ncbi:MAG TPA: hypothetical protein VFP60_05360 [Pseudolabrys sp.]|nr:hypothetical protein [Pseudolabrys sp.]
MRLTSVQIERTLDQFDGEVVPEDNPVVEDLVRFFGNHTYFLDQTGLNIIEPAGANQQDGQVGVVVNIASWTEADSPALAPHEPEITDVFVSL